MSFGTLIQQGRFTSAGAAVDLDLRADIDYIRVVNQTQLATTQATGRGVVFEWFRGLADNYAIEYKKTNSTDALNLVQVTSGGFLAVNTTDQTPEAAKQTSGTDVTNANPAAVTVTSHGYSNGDRILIYGTTSMLQISGYEFTIGNVSTNAFDLSYLDASGFADAATAGFVRRIPNDPYFLPWKNYITNITAANPAVVTLSITHGLSVNQIVHFHVPSAFGMDEIDGLTGKITAVNTSTNTITVDIDASGFTTFAFPLSTAATVTPAHITIPSLKSQTVIQPFQNQGKLIMRLAAGAQSPAGSSSDVIYWQAYKAFSVDNT